MAEKTTEELLELIEKSGKAEEVFKKLKEGADETVKALENVAKALEKIGVHEDKAAIAADEYRKSSMELASHEAQMASLRGDKIKQMKEEENVLKLLSDKHGAINSAGRETLDLMAKEVGLTVKQIEAMRDRQEAFAKLGPMYSKALEKGTSFATGLGSAMSIYSDTHTKMFNSFIDGVKTMRSDKGFKGLVDGFTSIINPTNLSIAVIGLMVSETIKMAFAVDKASAAFAAGTGAGRMYTEGINSVTSANRQFGISAGDSGKAFETLFSSFRGFQNESAATQNNLAATVAGLEKLGVGAGESSEVINFMNINLGKSGIESARLTKQLALTGKSIGMTAKQMMSGYKESLKSLAVYGDGAAKVFTNLASQAKAAGVEVSALLGLAEKFDTFSGAADAAGKLNAILGTQLSATELLTMKEDERIETLISSIQAQGIAFKEMGRFEQKAIAAAAGISDLNEAQKIFKMSVGDYKNFSAAAAASAKSQEEFNQRMSDTMDVVKKLQVLAMSFAIAMGPMVEQFGYFVEHLTWLLTWNDGIIATILGFVAGAKLLAVVIGALGGKFVATKIAMMVMGPATAATGTALTGLEKVAVKTSKGLGAAGVKMAPFSLAILGIGVGIGIAAAGMALLTSQLIGLVAEAAKAPGAFLEIAAGIMEMGLALNVAGTPFAMAGLFALAGLFAGISMVVDVDFDNMDKAFNTIADKSALIKPILGDLALLTVGQNSSGMTTNNAMTNLQQFSATLENIFKPEVKVFIGDTELEQIVESVVAAQAQKS
jgi:hypothetical protein